MRTASQGFGRAGGNSRGHGPTQSSTRSKNGNSAAIEPNQLLKVFFEARDKSVVAEEHASSLSEKFFFVLDSFMGMAVKEGNQEVKSALQQTLEAAMKVKQRSLRPEIQLLNLLLSDESFADRAVRLSSDEALETLKLNNGYFFQLLKMMTTDARRSSGSAYSSSTLEKLDAIEKECKARMESSTSS